MIIVDQALKAREDKGDPFRVAMAGAGFMAKGIALQIIRYVPGLELVAVANRHVEKAISAYADAGIEEVQTVDTSAQLQEAIARKKPAVTEDAMMLCEVEDIDVVLEVTGAVEFGAQLAVHSIDHGKHFVTMNAEVDGTVGSILKVRADNAGVVFSGARGRSGILRLYRGID